MGKNWLGKIWDWFVDEGQEASLPFSVMGLCMSSHMSQKRMERSAEKLKRFNDPAYTGTSSASGICEAAEEYLMCIGDGIWCVSYMIFWGILFILLRMLVILFAIFVCVPLLLNCLLRS